MTKWPSSHFMLHFTQRPSGLPLTSCSTYTVTKWPSSHLMLHFAPHASFSSPHASCFMLPFPHASLYTVTKRPSSHLMLHLHSDQVAFLSPHASCSSPHASCFLFLTSCFTLHLMLHLTSCFTLPPAHVSMSDTSSTKLYWFKVGCR